MTHQHFCQAIFCEDIRVEYNEMLSLIGILPDNIDVAGFPGAMPKLGVYVRINLDHATGLIPVHFKLLGSGDETIFEEAVKEETIAKAISEAQMDENPLATLVSRLLMGPFIVKDAGRVRLVVNIDGADYLAGSLNFRTAAA